MMKKLLTMSWWALVAGFVLCVFFSPRLSYQVLERSFSDYITTLATPRDCEMVRRGDYHADGIVCTLDYTVAGKAVSARALAWESDDAFQTQAGLHRRWAALTRGQPVQVDIERPSRIDRPEFVPQAWLAAPAWAVGMLVYAGLLGAVIWLCIRASGAVLHRADYDYDAHGELVRKPSAGLRGKLPRQLGVGLLWCLLLAATLYAVTNRPANHLLLLGRDLVEVPGILTDCGSHYRGTSKGHDQIECDVVYRWQGRALRAQAEAIDFRFFPTRVRLDAAADAAEGRRVIAYMDPDHPSYAIAFVDDDLVALQTIGLAEVVIVFFWFGGATWLLWRTRRTEP